MIYSPTELYLFYQEPLTPFTGTEAVAIFAFTGLLIGSFLNVVIHRLPLMMAAQWREQARDFLELPAEDVVPFSLASPGSQCPSCQQPIKPYENIPILSWLLLGRKCSHCHLAISGRYPLVELLSALLSGVVAYQLGITLESLLVLLLTFHLIAIAFIDYDHQIIPDSLVLPLLWLILICAVTGFPQSAPEAIVGAAVGYLSLWSVSKLYKLVRKIEGIGHGDFKLLAIFGALSGWQSVFTTLILAAFIGLVFALPLLFKKSSLQTAIPFGPAIAIAGWITLIFNSWVIL